VDVTNPAAPQLVHGADGFFTARRIALNGSGLGVLAPDGDSFLEVYNTSDPNQTGNRVLQFPLGAGARDVAISRGLGYVAAGNQLSVVSYLPFDNQGVAPTVTMTSLVSDLDPQTPGVQALEGSTAALVAAVADDMQVRDVTLLVNGQPMASDVSYPFDFFTPLPLLSEGAASVTLQLRATDTGGNSALSEMLTLQLTPDVFGPMIESLDPADGSRRFVGQRTARVRFSEPIAAGSVSPENFQLIWAGPSGAFDDGDDVPLAAVLQLRDGDRLAQMTTAPLEAGLYQVRLQESGITDRAGNALGDGVVVATFTVVEFEGSADFLPFGTDIFISQDDISLEISPMPFPFELFGEEVAGPMFVNSNGVIEFEVNTLDGGYQNERLPGVERIAAYPFFDDIDPSEAGRIGLFDGEGVRAITWEGIPYYGRSGTNVTFQIAFLANGTVQVRYGEITSPPGGTADSGDAVNTATIGLSRGQQIAVPNLGRIANNPELAITDDDGILDAQGLAALDALAGNDLLVFEPDGEGGYQILHNPHIDPLEASGASLDALFAEEEQLAGVLQS
jgi:hypothetical protein